MIPKNRKKRIIFKRSHINSLDNILLPSLIKKFNYFKRKYYLFIITFFFITSLLIPPVIAQVAQNNPMQLNQQSQDLYRRGELEAAVKSWQETVTAFADRGDTVNQAIALSNLSLTQQKLGQWQAATTSIEDSLKLIKDREQSKNQQQVLAQILDIQGNLQRETGQSAKALETWQKAAIIYQETQQLDKFTQTKINQTQAMQDVGLYPRACRTLLTTLEAELKVNTCPQLSRLTLEELNSRLETIIAKEHQVTTVLSLRSLGDLLRVVGELNQSAAILNTSLGIARKLNLPAEEAAIYLSLGNTNQALAQGTEIERFFRRKFEKETENAYLQAAQLAPSATIEQQANLNRLNFLLQKEKWSDAAQLWQQLQPEINNLYSNRSNLYVRVNFAHNLIEVLADKKAKLPPNSQLPNFEEIDSILANAAIQARNIGDTRTEAYAIGDRGRLAELTNNLSAAEQYTIQAINLAPNFTSSDIAYQYFWQLGRIQKDRNKIPQAVAAYTKAFEALQALRGDLVAINPEVQFSFRETVEPVYRQLVELDLEYANDLQKTGNETESKARLTQARTVIESLQLAELNNFFREACIDAQPRQIDEIDRNAAVIYPIILPEQNKLEILLSLPGKDAPQLYTKEVSTTEISDTVVDIKSSLLEPQSITQRFLPQYQKVYDWLIRPLETELVNAEVKTLAFVLDGDLRNIPMSVLHDGNRYLIEKYAIALTPGLQLLDPKPLTQIELQTLTAGLSETRPDFEPHQGFDPLPNVPQELENVAKVGSNVRSLLNAEFTQTALKQEINSSRSPVVHLATHAKFSSKAEDTFILAWDERINIQQLDELLRDDTLQQRTPIEILVLSACETAEGDDKATLGLAGVAVKAGARSTLATLWRVVDQSTAQIMTEFYHQLEQSQTIQTNKAEALRQAQLSLIKDEKYNHPHFWSPFVLIGNWQ